MSDRLSDAEYAEYKQVVLERHLRQGTSSDEPVAIILAGQPGSGKTGLRKEAQRQLNGSGGAVLVDPDECRAFHPHYENWAKEDDRTAATRTHPDASRVSNDLREQAMAERKNLIIDGTLRDAEKAQRLVSDLKQNGYRVEVHALCVKPEDSWKSVQERYETQRSEQGWGRDVPKHIHDEAAAGMPKSLVALERQGVVDQISVGTREGRVLHSSSPSQHRTPAETEQSVKKLQTAFVEHGARKPEDVGLDTSRKSSKTDDRSSLKNRMRDRSDGGPSPPSL